jgi:integrase/recombinase XerD
MNMLHSAVDDYLVIRRALGFKLERHDRFLHAFVDYLDTAGSDVITIDLAVACATQPGGTDPSWWAARLSMIRSFASYHHGLDPRTQVPPPDLMPGRSRRAEPFLYTNDQVTALQDAARLLKHPLMAATYTTLIGLLAVSGMRVGEAIRLDRTDIDPTSGLLTIRDTKFGKTRQIPLHPSTLAALDTYAQIRDRHPETGRTAAWFSSTVGTRLIYKNVHCCFHQLTINAGIRPRSPRCRPRIHDLRHRFATVTLTNWYADGQPIDSRLPLLSTYLGHISPSSTYWYLTATPELLGLAMDRLDHAREVLP